MVEGFIFCLAIILIGMEWWVVFSLVVIHKKTHHMAYNFVNRFWYAKRWSDLIYINYV